jgi:hypothetical protein
MKNAVSAGVCVYSTGLEINADWYESAASYVNAGVIPLQCSSAVAMYCKLWLAISNSIDLKSVMAISVARDKAD